MDDLRKTFCVINQMRDDGVIGEYAVAGAVAALYYVEPALTEDLDIMISIENLGSSGIVTLEPLFSYLRDRGYTEWRKEGLVVEGWPVQFLPVTDALDKEALGQALEVEIEPGQNSEAVKITILSAEHLAAIALRVGRPKDRERILRFVNEKVLDLRKFREIVRSHGMLPRWSRFCAETNLKDLDETKT